MIGTAIGLNLLFGIPLEIGVLITALDVFLILWLQNKGFRWIEAFIITLLGVIAVCFVVQIALADPDWGAVIRGFAPTTEIVTNPDMLYLALGIIGATVMPHNLYLHSGIVQTRAYGETTPEKREAVKFATIDSTVALMFALTINASILILAAATFTPQRQHRRRGARQGAHAARAAARLGDRADAVRHRAAVLRPQLDRHRDDGRPDRDGRLPRHPPAALGAPARHPRSSRSSRRRSSRSTTARAAPAKLLILSQVILSLQLPFAVVPLVMFTAAAGQDGRARGARWLTALAGVIAAIIIALNVKLIVDFVWS